MSRARDAHARRPDRGRRHAVLYDRGVCAWRERGKANGGGVSPEGRVDVLEECVTDDPLWPGAGPRKHEDGPDTMAA